jgi:inner membrane protein
MARFDGYSPGLKAAALGVLALVLLVPIALVGDLIRERSERAHEAEATIARQWGRAQTLAPAYLVADVPTRQWQNGGWLVAPAPHALFPDRVDVDGVLHTELRTRGMFEVPVYRAELTVTARFAAAEVAALRDSAEGALAFRFGVSDPVGLREVRALKVDGRELAATPSGRELGSLRGLGATLADAAGDVEVTYALTLAGVGTLDVLPLARTTRVSLRGGWPHPSFSGAFLPTQREVRRDGFAATWQVLELGREYPQTGPLSGYDDATLAASVFGTALYLPANVYQQNERSSKYGVLMVALMFVAMFLFEILAGIRLHPLQYLLVGFALATFYVLLLALSEHAGFARAYLAAASASVAIVGGYAAAILQSRRRAGVLAGLQASAYGVFFVLVRSEDYALLMGALVLTVALAAIMWLTRRMDWYGLAAARA